jgi:hypothetical protein
MADNQASLLSIVQFCKTVPADRGLQVSMARVYNWDVQNRRQGAAGVGA